MDYSYSPRAERHGACGCPLLKLLSDRVGSDWDRQRSGRSRPWPAVHLSKLGASKRTL